MWKYLETTLLRAQRPRLMMDSILHCITLNTCNIDTLHNLILDYAQMNTIVRPSLIHILTEGQPHNTSTVKKEPWSDCWLHPLQLNRKRLLVKTFFHPWEAPEALCSDKTCDYTQPRLGTGVHHRGWCSVTLLCWMEQHQVGTLPILRWSIVSSNVSFIDRLSILLCKFQSIHFIYEGLF